MGSEGGSGADQVRPKGRHRSAAVLRGLLRHCIPVVQTGYGSCSRFQSGGNGKLGPCHVSHPRYDLCMLRFRYRETALLFDPKFYSAELRLQVAEVIVHELSHQARSSLIP